MALSRKARVVLAVLRRHAAEADPVRMFMAELAEEAKYGEWATRRAVRELEQRRFLVVTWGESRNARRKFYPVIGPVKNAGPHPPRVTTFAPPADPLTRRPWCDLTATGRLYLQYRLGRASNHEIASECGVTYQAVRQSLKDVIAVVRAASPLPVHGIADVLLQAQSEQVPARFVGRTHAVSDSDASLQTEPACV